MVECECKCFASYSGAVEVLIDTWWNVNSNNNGGVQVDTIVLIDTWWNVNVA